MWRQLREHLSPPMVIALIALFVALGGTTYAATGDKFILGKSNSADQTSSLSSTASNPALKVENTGTGVALLGTSSANNGIQASAIASNRSGVAGYHLGTNSGYGVYASTGPGDGVFGSGGTAGGSFTGQSTGDGVQGKATADHKSGVYAHHDGGTFGYGLFATAATGVGVSGSGSTAGAAFDGRGTGDGVQGAATADSKSGVWAHHDGRNFGYGLFAQSDTGPAIGLQGDPVDPVITLNGNPFPAATAGFKDDFVDLPDDGTHTTVATLDGIAPGTYVVIASFSVGLDFSNRVDCELDAGSDSDYKWVSGDVGHTEMTLLVFHGFAPGESASLTCWTSDTHSSIRETKIVAVQVAGGTKTALP
jgi:hypothetical protein